MTSPIALPPRRDRFARAWLACVPALAAMALLAGCAVTPQPITQPEHVERAQNDYKTIYADYVPLEGKLTLADAIARALKYNYDAQLSRVQLSLQERQMDLALMQMLPRLAATAGFNARNNDNAAESVSELTHQRTLEYSYSEEPSHDFASLELSWNLLDFGVSYFQAKQQGYRIFIAVERRRKVINSIIKSVQDAYWRAVTAERLLPRLQPLLHDAERMLEASRTGRRSRLEPDMQALDYQQALLTVVGQLRHMQTDLNAARVQLATLINVPVETKLQFAQPDRDLAAAGERVAPRQLEEIGLVMRPELREEAYQEKIDTQDIYKEIIKMLPGVGILGGLNYDSNKYLYNPTWGNIGIQATFNLVNLIQGPKAIAAAETSVDVSRTRRLALSIAVLSQVNLSYQEYLTALDDLQTAREIDSVQTDIQRASRNASLAQAQPDSERVRRELAGLAAELAQDRALAAVHSALATVYTSVGADLVPPTADITDLPKLTDEVKGAIAGWESGHLPKIDLPPPANEHPG